MKPRRVQTPQVRNSLQLLSPRAGHLFKQVRGGGGGGGWLHGELDGRPGPLSSREEAPKSAHGQQTRVGMSVLGGNNCWEFKCLPVNAGFVLSQRGCILLWPSSAEIQSLMGLAPANKAGLKNLGRN